VGADAGQAGQNRPLRLMVERLDDPVSGHLERAGQIVPDCDAELVAGLGEAQESVATIAADSAACPGADLSCHVAPDIVFRSFGVERDLRPVQHYQQLSLVGMQRKRCGDPT
jgi:hypothetical protein